MVERERVFSKTRSVPLRIIGSDGRSRGTVITPRGSGTLATKVATTPVSARGRHHFIFPSYLREERHDLYHGAVPRCCSRSPWTRASRKYSSNFRRRLLYLRACLLAYGFQCSLVRVVCRCRSASAGTETEQTP
jgi:hypothetical protein